MTDCAEGLKTKVTDTVLLTAPVAATVIMPEYVPDDNPEEFAVTVTVAEVPEPEVGDKLNHGTLSVTDHAALELILMFKFCAGGLAPPATPLKDNDPGLTVMT